MPESAIGDLPQAEFIDDSDAFLIEQGGVAKHILGTLLKSFIDRNILGITFETLPAGSDVSGSYNAETGILHLGIPRSLGAVNSVDGVQAGTNGDVPLCAISYDRGQSLTAEQKSRARTNLGLSPAAVAELPLAVAYGGLGTSTLAAAQEKIVTAQYVEGSTTSINDITKPGIYIIFIPSDSSDAGYLGWSGYAMVEVLGFGATGYSPRYIQRITQMASGRVSVRYALAENSWSYDTTLVLRSFAVTIAAGASQKITLAPFRNYFVSTYRHTWIVSTGSADSAPLVSEICGATAPGGLTCTAGDDCSVTIASSSYSYGFYITQI